MLGKSNISIRKTDVKTQKSLGNAPQKIVFAHQASSGDSGFSLAALVTPTAAMPGFVNPDTTTLASAQIYINQKGLTIISSIRGPLIPASQYTVSSNTQINFVGWTAEDTEFFFCVVDYQKQGKYFVDATQIVKTYLLPAGDTEVLTGAYPLNMFPTEQVGAVMVFAGSTQQFRNSGNAAASPSADGNYQETGSSIIFNTAFGEDTPILIVSTGLLVNNPEDSRDAVLDLIAGQMDLVIADLALATGNPLSRYQANPNKPDLTAFGTRLRALEKNEYATSSSQNVVDKDVVFANTSGGGITLTLPASPSLGDEVIVHDAKGTFGTYSLILGRNGSSIKGIADDYECDISGKMWRAVFVDAVYGWAIYY